VDLFVAGELTTLVITDQLRTTRQTLCDWCQKPAFQAEFLKRLRAVEWQAYGYGISRRVERVAAINEQWLKLREEMNQRKAPRTD
jgi:hypothetical protein